MSSTSTTTFSFWSRTTFSFDFCFFSNAKFRSFISFSLTLRFFEICLTFLKILSAVLIFAIFLISKSNLSVFASKTKLSSILILNLSFLICSYTILKMQWNSKMTITAKKSILMSCVAKMMRKSCSLTLTVMSSQRHLRYDW